MSFYVFFSFTGRVTWKWSSHIGPLRVGPALYLVMVTEVSTVVPSRPSPQEPLVSLSSPRVNDRVIKPDITEKNFYNRGFNFAPTSPDPIREGLGSVPLIETVPWKNLRDEEVDTLPFQPDCSVIPKSSTSLHQSPERGSECPAPRHPLTCYLDLR